MTFSPDESLSMLRLVTDQPESTIYRVALHMGRVDVMCIGLERIDSALEGIYDSLDELPQWVQERIAVLSMMDYKPPTKDVPKVGRRISQHTYWVYIPDS